ncbi:hypothetical protein PRZ48_005225 [Zasmidium cellare]|uniref:SH3 domain-containing protein n=1 Tax=Zasmidium cellare TaxID=395010 RepID=A0ABR0ERU0_ZASCE|nr:hypothetical protein PRZ48_005225 [Zasmidium cellare]
MAAKVMAAPSSTDTSSATPSFAVSAEADEPHEHMTESHRPQPRERIPSMSSYSKRTSRSRPHSNSFPPFQSSLSYALVRDFAYPTFHPMHFGGPPEDPSGASTPGSEWNAGRRASDSAEGSAMTGRGAWSAGPWGGDGLLYGDPEQEMEPLPSTSFSSGDDEWEEGETSFRRSKHRKSRSFADIPNYERGRRRESGHRMSRDSDPSLLAGSQNYDPAGRDALRQSRGFVENGEPRRDSHFATTLPNRSFHTSQTIDPDSDLPLDAEPSNHSPQRESLGPEDEELFAGPSLALYSFEPENDNELRLTEGQTILVAYRHGQGWLVAENPQTGEQGLVPEQYVRLLRDIDGWDEERGGFIDDDELEGEAGNGVEIDDKELEATAGQPRREDVRTKSAPDTTNAGDDLDYDLEMKKMNLD